MGGNSLKGKPRRNLANPKFPSGFSPPRLNWKVKQPEGQAMGFTPRVQASAQLSLHVPWRK